MCTAQYVWAFISPENMRAVQMTRAVHDASSLVPTAVSSSHRTKNGALHVGGFDVRYQRAAEDLDLGYRWLRDGRSIRYEPQMLVQHNAWRSQIELEALFKIYAEDFGKFVGRHVAEGDRWLAREAASVLKRSVQELRSSDRSAQSVAEAKPMITHAPRGFAAEIFETMRTKRAER